MKKDQLKGGISAMFGDGSQTAPKGVQLTDDQGSYLRNVPARHRQIRGEAWQGGTAKEGIGEERSVLMNDRKLLGS